MSKAGLLASSVSAFALMCFAVDAHTLMSDPAHPNMQVTPDRIIQSQAATDKYRQRRFNIILKPEAAAAAAAVQNYFNGFGFQTQYHPYTNSIEVRGTYAQAEQAGGFTYVAPNATGTTPGAPYQLSSAPHFPASISNAILATTFDPGPVMEPQFSVTINAPSLLPVHFGLAGLAPEDYATLYGYNQLYAAGINGSGQVVDIAACYGYLHGATPGVNDDITIFGQDFGLSPLPPNITAFYPSGHGVVSYSFEPLLDLSRVYGTAPGAAIRIWFSPNCTFGEFTNLFLDIANDQQTHGAAAFTVSYGLPELRVLQLFGSTEFIAADAALSAITGGASQKVALFAASGDNGDESIRDYFVFRAPQHFGLQLGTADVLFFASDPNVISVGGTTVFPVSPTNVQRSAEFAWSGATEANLGGSGGGVSNIWGLPPWQRGVSGTASQTFKNLPDVSSNASVESAVLAVRRGQVVQTGGTSASSPTWAGTVALLQQLILNSFHFTVNNWPGILYSNPELFTGITAGSNGRYIAGPGYNNVTGLGVPCLYATADACANGSTAEAAETPSQSPASLRDLAARLV